MTISKGLGDDFDLRDRSITDIIERKIRRTVWYGYYILFRVRETL